MKPEEARAIAESFLQAQNMRGYNPVFLEVRSHHRWPNEWSVIFELFTKSGHYLVDGPMVVIVDKTTRQAHIFESP